MKTGTILLGVGVSVFALAAYNRKKQTAAVGRIFKEIPTEFFECLDGTYSDHNRNRACTRHGGMVSDEPIMICDTDSTPGSSTSTNLNVFDVPVRDIKLYLEKFQNRESPYSIDSVQRIVDAAHNGTFRFEEFDPVLLWKAPDGNIYMLSGHSRLEAFRRLADEGLNDFSRIPAKIIAVPQAEAEEIALRSNTLSTKEKDTERALFYRKQIDMGKSYAQVIETARKNEGKDAVRIMAYAYLNPVGKTFVALQALEAGDPTSQTIIKAIAQWIGEARMKFPMLTDQHENEIYDWLVNGGFGKQYKRKEDYLAKLAAVIHQRTEFGVFNQDAPLNLFNAAQKSFGEKQFDEQVFEKKEQIRDLQRSIDAKISDYRGRGASQEDILRVMDNDYRLLNRLQLQLLELEKKRGSVITESKRELALFGIRKISGVRYGSASVGFL